MYVIGMDWTEFVYINGYNDDNNYSNNDTNDDKLNLMDSMCKIHMSTYKSQMYRVQVM